MPLASGYSDRSGDLDGGRTAVLTDLGPTIPQISLETFLSHFLPSTNYDVQRTVQELKKKRSIRKGRWVGFPKDPGQSRVTEDKAFAPLAGLVRDIIKCSKHNSVVAFAQNPHQAPWSDRSNKTRPDGYFILKDKGAAPPTTSIKGKAKLDEIVVKWNDIALSAELKNKSTQATTDDNVRKILWSMQHVMRSDACRRFTFGFTIENTDMRIWVCCRSMVVVTEPFNFVEDYTSLITFVLAVSSASQVELGWDPTVKRLYDGSRAFYEIAVRCNVNDEVTERIYRTSQILSDHSADALRGRGSRVFKAHLLDTDGKETGDPVAIKDVWLDNDHDREGDIMRAIYDDVSAEDRITLRKYLLTMECHGDVFVNGKQDQTLDQSALGPVADFHLRRTPLAPQRPFTSSVGLAPSVHVRAPPEPSRQYPPKVHYRIVFKEVGTSLYVVRSLANVFQSLRDVINVLEILHKYSWVHRDISPGNIIFYDGGGRLSDFEYAKKTTRLVDDEVLTGTLDFMSVEVESRRYLFRPPTSYSVDLENYVHRTTAGSHLFRYNPLHDIESTWWIGVWIITCNGVMEDKRSVEDVEKQKRRAREFFPQTTRSADRLSLLSANTLLGSLIEQLPGAFLGAGSVLDWGRAKLLGRYKQAEAHFKIDEKAFHGIHAQISLVLERAIKESGQIQLCYLDQLILLLKQDLEQEDTANTFPPSPAVVPPPAMPPDMPLPASESGKGKKRKRSP